MIQELSIYINSLRAYSFPLSISSALIGPAWAYNRGYKIDTVPLLLLCASVLLFHSAVNMLNDYYDYNRGVDKNERQLAVQKKDPEFLLYYALFLFFIGASCGAALVFLSGPPLLVMGITGAALSFFYTGKKFSLKYMALGEITVFITFGPLLGTASLYAVNMVFSPKLIILSCAPGLLAALVLFLNNLRDVKDDSSAGIKTLPMFLSCTSARRFALILLILPFLILITGTITGIFSIYMLTPLISLTSASNIFKELISKNKTSNFNKALMSTIKVHTLFTLLSILALTVPSFAGGLF